jgi:hypothetical protein
LDIGYFLISLFDIYLAKVRPSMIRPAQLVVCNVGLQAIVPGSSTPNDIHFAIDCVNKAFGRAYQFVTLRFKFGFFSRASPVGDRCGSIGLPAPARSKMSHHSGGHTAPD